MRKLIPPILAVGVVAFLLVLVAPQVQAVWIAWEKPTIDAAEETLSLMILDPLSLIIMYGIEETAQATGMVAEVKKNEAQMAVTAHNVGEAIGAGEVKPGLLVLVNAVDVPDQGKSGVIIFTKKSDVVQTTSADGAFQLRRNGLIAGLVCEI